MASIFKNLIDFFEDKCLLPTDSNEVKVKKTSLLIISHFCMIAGLIWGAFYYYLLGFSTPIFFPFGFSIIIGIAIVIAFFTKKCDLLLYSQLTLILLLPTTLQWTLGGFSSSGAVILWAILAPIGSLVLQDTKAALNWLYTLIALILVSFYFDKVLLFTSVITSHFHQTIFFSMNIIGVTITVFFTMYHFVRALKKEHDRSENLLLNILPQPIAERLKKGQETIADDHQEISVLFADIVGFTQLTEKLSAREIVKILNRLFSEFDLLSKKYKMEKIKTIGDSYMVVGGIDQSQENHAVALVNLGLGMLKKTKEVNNEFNQSLALRIGIHSGSAIAGVIGLHKITYDLWGDTVNTASRVESYGLSNKVQVSETTYRLAKKYFKFEKRILRNVKGKGNMNAYLIVEK